MHNMLMMQTPKTNCGWLQRTGIFVIFCLHLLVVHKEVVCDYKVIFLHRIMILDIVQHNNKMTMCLLMHLQREHFNAEANFWQYILYKALCHTRAFWFMKLYLLSYCWLAHILHIHKASLETNFTKLRSASNTIIVK